MKLVARLSIVTVFGLACAACSNTQSPPRTSAPPAAIPPPASAIPMTAPASGTSNALPPLPPVKGPALDVILQRPAFAKAFDAMDGSASLPAWVKQEGVSTPSTQVVVDGRKLWLAQTCKTADCQGSQLLLLVGLASHTMQGLFVQVSGGEAASVRKLTWLGRPDAAEQDFLKDRIARD